MSDTSNAAPAGGSLIARVGQVINTVPITVSVAAGMTPAAISPVIMWGLSGFPKPVPPDVPLSIAGLVVIAAHGVKKFAEPWLAKRLGV